MAAVLVFAAMLAAGISAIGRSLWLDEAWIANSILQLSIAGMFHYPAGCKNPPLFLLLARGTERALGLATVLACFRSR